MVKDMIKEINTKADMIRVVSAPVILFVPATVFVPAIQSVVAILRVEEAEDPILITTLTGIPVSNLKKIST